MIDRKLAKSCHQIGRAYGLSFYEGSRRLSENEIIDAQKKTIKIKSKNKYASSKIVEAALYLIFDNIDAAEKSINNNFAKKTEKELAKYISSYIQDVAPNLYTEIIPLDATDITIVADRFGVYTIKKHETKHAVFIYQSLVELGLNKHNMLKTQRWLMNNKLSYKIYTNNLVTKLRLKSTIPSAKKVSYSSIYSEPWIMGGVACKTYRHHLNCGSNKKEVFEKVYSRPRFSHVKKELTLYSHIDTNNLMAPKFIGASKSKKGQARHTSP